MKKISILIPTRNNNDELRATIQSCIGRAMHPQRLEFIVRLDYDAELALLDEAWVPLTKIIIGPRMGYKHIHAYYEECYRLSSGDLILAFNDDVRMESHNWDAIFEDALEKIPYGVASCHIDEGNGTNYEWAMPMVRRDLCEAIGQFCAGTETCERIFDAYAARSKRGVKANVKMIHKWHHPEPGTERAEVYNHATDHWSEMVRKWEDAAMEMIRLVDMSF